MSGSQPVSIVDDGKQAKVTAEGEVNVRVTTLSGTVNAPLEGKRPTFRAAVLDLIIAAAATDIFTIAGANGKTVRVTSLRLSGIAGTAVTVSASIVKRSAANTGGTSTAPTAVPLDSASPAAAVTLAAYTDNPTTSGTTVGIIATEKLTLPLTTTVVGKGAAVDFGIRNSQPVVLRNGAESLAVNLNGVTVSGPKINLDVEWTEE